MSDVFQVRGVSWQWANVRTGEGRALLRAWPGDRFSAVIVGDALVGELVGFLRPDLVAKATFFSFEMFGHQREAAAGLVDSLKNAALRSAHDYCLRRYPKVVFSNELRRDFYLAQRPGLAEKSFVFENFTPRSFAERVSPESVGELSGVLSSFRRRHEVLVTYCGLIQPGRDVEALVDAARQVPSVGLVLAGPDKIGLGARLADVSNILYLGDRPHRDVRFIMQCCDWGYLYYSNEIINTRFCAPLKVWEYRASGLRILANRNQALLGKPELVDRYFADEDLPSILSGLRRPVDKPKFPEGSWFEDRFASLLVDLGWS